METAVEQTETTDMAKGKTPKKKPSSKTGTSKGYNPYAFRVRKPRKPKSRKSKK